MCTYDNMFAEFILELEIFLTEVVEKIKIHILCSITLSKNRTIYEKMWKIIVQSAGHR